MTDNSNVLSVAERFRGERVQQRQQILHGEVALEKLRNTPKLSKEDRVRIAEQIGRCIHETKLDSRDKRAELAHEFLVEPKELYRLVLRPGLTPGQQALRGGQLRARGENYAKLIETIAKLAHRNPFDLASGITYGSSVHPYGEMSPSVYETIRRMLYEVADGMDHDFDLSAMFSSIAEMKVAGDWEDPWKYWPANPSEDSAIDEQETKLRDSFWISQQPHYGKDAFHFHNWWWQQIVGYLPHLYLGMGFVRRFVSDTGWTIPNWVGLVKEESRESPLTEWELQRNREVAEQWISRQALSLFNGHDKISVQWDDDGNRLLFNEASPENIRYRLWLLQQDIGQFQEDHEERMNAIIKGWIDPDRFNGKEYAMIDPPVFYWIALYPNPGATGVVPVLLRTNLGPGDLNMVELITEDVLEGMSQIRLFDGETLFSRLKKTLGASDSSGKSILQKELERTAEFVKYHPLRKRYKASVDAEYYIRDWRGKLRARGAGGRTLKKPDR